MLTEQTIQIPNDELIYYVLNEKNKYITKDFIDSIFEKYRINHRVKNLPNFQRAMVHSSYIIRDLKEERLAKIIKEKNLQKIPHNQINNVILLQKKSYETLEFRGDSVIHDVLGNYLCDRYEDADEGFMTRLRSNIENGDSLANFSKILGFHEYMLIGRNLEQMGDRLMHSHILEDVFEAFIGALKMEASYEICEKLIVNLIEKEIDFSTLIHIETNYKGQILKFYHIKGFPDPEYISKGTIEKNNKKIFTMAVKGFVNSNNGEKIWTEIAEGVGFSKKIAEQAAAKNALIYYNYYKQNDDDVSYEEIFTDDNNVYV